MGSSPFYSQEFHRWPTVVKLFVFAPEVSSLVGTAPLRRTCRQEDDQGAFSRIELVPSFLIIMPGTKTPQSSVRCRRSNAVGEVGRLFGGHEANLETERTSIRPSDHTEGRPPASAILDAAEVTKKSSATWSWHDAQEKHAPCESRSCSNERLAMFIVNLEQTLARMKEVENSRQGEHTLAAHLRPSDFARTRLQPTSFYYLFGTLRAGTEFAAEKSPWNSARAGGLENRVCHPTALLEGRSSQSDGPGNNRSTLEKIQEEHAGTQWAYFAERESKSDKVVHAGVAIQEIDKARAAHEVSGGQQSAYFVARLLVHILLRSW